MKNRYHDLLLKSLDVTLSAAEQEMLRSALADSEALRKEKEKLLKIRSTISETAVTEFPPGFEVRVMSTIARKNQVEIVADLFAVFKPVAIAATILIVLIASINIMQDDEFSLNNLYSTGEVSIEQAFNPLVELIQE